MKARPLEAQMFNADGRTDIATLTVAFRNFDKALKNQSNLYNV